MQKLQVRSIEILQDKNGADFKSTVFSVAPMWDKDLQRLVHSSAEPTHRNIFQFDGIYDLVAKDEVFVGSSINFLLSEPYEYTNKSGNVIRATHKRVIILEKDSNPAQACATQLVGNKSITGKVLKAFDDLSEEFVGPYVKTEKTVEAVAKVTARDEATIQADIDKLQAKFDKEVDETKKAKLQAKLDVLEDELLEA